MLEHENLILQTEFVNVEIVTSKEILYKIKKYQNIVFSTNTMDNQNKKYKVFNYYANKVVN